MEWRTSRHADDASRTRGCVRDVHLGAQSSASGDRPVIRKIGSDPGTARQTLAGVGLHSNPGLLLPKQVRGRSCPQGITIRPAGTCARSFRHDPGSLERMPCALSDTMAQCWAARLSDTPPLEKSSCRLAGPAGPCGPWTPWGPAPVPCTPWAVRRTLYTLGPLAPVAPFLARTAHVEGCPDGGCRRWRRGRGNCCQRSSPRRRPRTTPRRCRLPARLPPARPLAGRRSCPARGNRRTRDGQFGAGVSFAGLFSSRLNLSGLLVEHRFAHVANPYPEAGNATWPDSDAGRCRGHSKRIPPHGCGTRLGWSTGHADWPCPSHGPAKAGVDPAIASGKANLPAPGTATNVCFMQDSSNLETAWYPKQPDARFMLEHRDDPKRWLIWTVKDGVPTFRFQYTSKKTDPTILTAMVAQELEINARRTRCQTFQNGCPASAHQVLRCVVVRRSNALAGDRAGLGKTALGAAQTAAPETPSLLNLR